jgi:uncharacterized protein YlxW (UPF0749 family)
MSVFTSQIRHKPWLWQITLLATALGALLALSLKTQDRIRGEQLPGMRITQVAAAYADQRDTILSQKKQISDLQTNLAKYQKTAASESGTTRLLSNDLQKANILAGLVAVTGPGVVVTLRDSKNPPPKPADMAQDIYVEEFAKYYIIHDADIQMVINELRASGAEAIAVNDQRVVSTTAVRCVGPVVMVNNTQTQGSPVRIAAIGDPETLSSALTMHNGVRDTFVNDPSMFSMDKASSLTLPAYAGASPLRFAKEAADASAEQAQKQSLQVAKDAPELPVTSGPATGDAGDTTGTTAGGPGTAPKTH